MNLSFSKVIVLSFISLFMFAACEICTTCTFYDDADGQVVYTINVTVTCIRE